MTQQGETTNYSVADHVEALLKHAGAAPQSGYRYINAVLVNDEMPSAQAGDEHHGASAPVRYDPDRLRKLAVVPVRRALLSPTLSGHHDPNKLARVIMLWYQRKRRRSRPFEKKTRPVKRPESSTDPSSIANQRIDARPSNGRTDSGAARQGSDNGQGRQTISAPSPDQNVLMPTSSSDKKQP